MMLEKRVPKLRFIEFSGEWKIRKLDEITSYVDYRGKTPLKSDTGTFLVTAKNIRMGYIDYEVSKEYIPTKTYQSVMRRGKPSVGDVLITTEAPLGNVATVDREDIALAQRVIKLSGKQSIMHNAFLKHQLLSENFQKELLEKATGGTAKGIKGSLLHKISLRFPDIQEQIKIADFLTAVDNDIQKITKKKALLEQYKKGVMQQIFSQKVRFKDDNGNNYPEWEKKAFSKVVTFHSTNSLSRNLLNYETGKVKNIHYGDIHTKFNANFDILSEQVPYINMDVDLSNMKHDSYCQEGDLIIADVSEDYKDIGKSIEIINLENQKLVSGLHTYIARDKIKMALGFKGYLMQTHKVRRQIMVMATGVSVLGISKTNLEKIEVSIPCFEEQAKIANFLTTIDEKIKLINTLLKQSKLFKKAMLQQLFI